MPSCAGVPHDFETMFSVVRTFRCAYPSNMGLAGLKARTTCAFEM
jgi:hypothetical protein